MNTCPDCRFYMPCKHSESRNDVICNKFKDVVYDDIVNNDDTDTINDTTDTDITEKEVEVVCDHANKNCEGCVCSTPHIYNKELCREDICVDCNNKRCTCIPVQFATG